MSISDMAADAGAVGERFNKIQLYAGSHIECGKTDVQFSATVRYYEVMFEKEFSDPPIVQLTVNSGQLAAHSRAFLTGTTITGFTFITYNSDNSVENSFVYWTAIEAGVNEGEQLGSFVTYNPSDDYLYIAGAKWKRAGLTSRELIPVLSSYDGDNGHVVVADATEYSGAEAWRTFDGDDTTYGYGGTSGYVGYQFDNKVTVDKISFIVNNPASVSVNMSSYVEYYNGVEWIQLPDEISYYGSYASSENKPFMYDLNGLECYGIRIQTRSTATGGGMASLCKLQIYGIESLSAGYLPPLTKMLSDSYSTIKTYELDEYCVHANALKKCIVPVTEPGEFNQSNWEITTVAKELQLINSKRYGTYDVTVGSNGVVAQIIPGNICSVVSMSDGYWISRQCFDPSTLTLYLIMTDQNGAVKSSGSKCSIRVGYENINS